MADEEVSRNILQMVFDNKQFDKNIAKSQKSLEDFKEAMDFEETSNGLERFASAANDLKFDNLGENIQRLADKFTGLGDAGEYVLSRVRAGIEQAARAVEDFAKSISTAQISIGQGKYDALNKAVMTISAAGEYTEEQAYKAMERLMTYTNETNYSFNDMVHQVSAFTSAGQGLWDAEEAMEGIANLSAKAGQGVTQASNAMSIFSKAIGAGYLGLQNWQSLNLSAHVATAEFRKVLMDTAVELGDLTKEGDKYYVSSKHMTESTNASTKAAKKKNKEQKKILVEANSLETTLNKRWATSEVIMAALRKYYFEDIDDPDADWTTFAGQAAKAAQRALSWMDALNAIKEAVSAGWLTSFRLMFGDLSEAMEHFTNLANRAIEVADKISEFRNGVLRTWAEEGGRTSFFRILFGDYGEETEGEVQGILDIIDNAGKLITDAFFDFVKLFASPDERELWNEKGFKEAWFGFKLNEITKSIQDFIAGIKGFFADEINVGGETKSRLQMIQESIQGVVAIVKMGYDTVMGILGFFSNIRSQLQPSFDSILHFLSVLGISLYDTAAEASDGRTISQFFLELAELVRPLTEGINSLVIAFTDLLGTLVETDDKTGVTKSIFSAIGDAFKSIANILSTVGKPILAFITSFFDILNTLIQEGFTKESMEKAGKALGDSFNNMLKGLIDALPESLGFVGDWLKDLFGLWEDDTEDHSKSLFGFIRTIFTAGFGGIGKFLGTITNGFSLKTWIDSGFGFGAAHNFLKTVAGWFKGTNLYGVIMAFLGVCTLANLFRTINMARKAVTSVRDFFGELGDSLASGFKVRYDDYGEYLMKMAEGIAIFVGCIAILGALPIPKLIQGMVALGLLLVTVWGFNKLMHKSMNDGSIGDQLAFAGQLIALAAVIALVTAAVSILMIAMVPLSKDPKQMATAVLGFVAILAAIGGFIYLLAAGLWNLSKITKRVSTFGKVGIKTNNEIGKLALLLLSFAAAIALIVGAISVLMLAVVPLVMTGWGGVARAIAAVAGILAVIGGFVMLMMLGVKKLSASLGGNSTFGTIAKTTASVIALSVSVVALSAGLGMLVLALTPLAAMDWGGWSRVVAGLGVLLVELGAFILIMNKLGSSTLSKKTGKNIFGSFMEEKETKELNARIAGLAGLAGGIGILVLALTPLAAMDWGQWAKVMAGLASIMTLLGVFMVAIKHFEIDNTKIIGLAGFAAGIGILVLALVPLSMMEPLKLVQALLGLIAVLFVMFEFMKHLKSQAIDTVKITGLIGFAAGMWLMIQAFLPLANMNLQQICNMLVGMIGVLTVVGLFLEAMQHIKMELKNSLGAFAMLISLSLLMIVFSLALNDVKDIRWETITAFSAGISAVLLALSGSLLILSKIGLGAGIKGIALLSIGIAAILGILALMLPVVMGAVGNSLAQMSSRLNLVSDLLKNFSASMNQVDGSSIDRAQGIFEKLKTMLMGLSGFGAYANDLDTFTTVLFDLGTTLEIFTDHTKDLQNPESSNVFKLIDMIVSRNDQLSSFTLGNAMTEITSMASGLWYFNSTAASIASPDDSNAFKLVDALLNKQPLLVAFTIGNSANSFTSLASGLYAFDYITKSITTADNPAVSLLERLAACAGSIDIIGKANVGAFKSNVAGLGGALSIYAKGAKEATGMEINEQTDVSGAILLLQKISESLADEGGFKIPDQFPSNTELTTFGSDLAVLALALSAFAEASQGLNENTQKALDVLTFLKDLKGQLNSEDLKVVNEFNTAEVHADAITTFANDIITLGLALMIFADAVSGFGGNTQSALDVLSFLANLKTNLTEDNIKAANVFNDAGVHSDTIASFALDIVTLGLCLRAYYEACKDFDYNKAKPALGIIDFLVDLQSKLNAQNINLAIINAFTDAEIDTNAITTFGKDIEELGKALAGFANSVNFTNEENGEQKVLDFDNAMKALDNFVALKDKLPNMDGLVAIFAGRKQTLLDLAAEVGALGGAMRTFSDTLTGNSETGDKGFDTVSVNAAIGVMDEVISLMRRISQELPKIGGLVNTINTLISGRDMTLGDIGDQLGPLGEGLGSLGEKVQGKFQDVKEIETALGIVSTLSEILTRFSQSDPNVSGSMGYAAALIDFVDYLANGLNNTPDGKERLSIIDDIINIMVGINSKINQLGKVDLANITAFKLMAEALAAISNIDASKDFENVGVSIAAGVARGIENSENLVVIAATNMAIEAYNAAMLALDASSPSKLFEEVGSFVSAGMAIGIGNNSYLVGDASERVSNEAVESARNIIASISRILAEDADASPTITPVLDLSNITAGIRDMNSSLSGSHITVGTSASMAGAAGGMLGRTSGEANQNGTDLSGVYERMGILGDTIAALGEDIRNMQLVLDTGVLAGGVSSGVDKKLGRNMLYAERRNG